MVLDGTGIASVGPWLRRRFRQARGSSIFRVSLSDVVEIAFQACLIDRSSISPSLESTTCERLPSDYRTRRRRMRALSSIPLVFRDLAPNRTWTIGDELCKTFEFLPLPQNLWVADPAN